jgi:2-polyprenyl-3-methyl-5-hydroxy-6-metoxy-1,4-benzoquinol methylase
MAIRESWDRNASAWAAAVREGRIPSRRLATDAAILEACHRALERREKPRVLDVGCGEGWLSWTLASRGAQVDGIDGSADLIALAQHREPTGDPLAAPSHATPPRFAAVSYEHLERERSSVPGPYDLVVCNYALLAESLAPLLAALRVRLAPGGAVVIQTVHPWAVLDGRRYVDTWREETFAAFEQPFPSPMPWYYRTLSSWVGTLGAAGLRLVGVDEPLHPESGAPLSLLMTAAP